MKAKTQTSVLFNTRTYEILKHIQEDTESSNIVRFIDKLFSLNRDNREWALQYLIKFQENVLNGAEFDEETGQWNIELKK